MGRGSKKLTPPPASRPSLIFPRRDFSKKHLYLAMAMYARIPSVGYLKSSKNHHQTKREEAPSMRILRFNVEKQRITKDEACDFSGLVAGSVGYLHAQFHFSEEWTRYTTKIARFWNDGKEHSTIIDSNNECEIPPEALTSEIFRVSVMGVDSLFRLETNKEKIRQGVN